jgi:hypothetical protein
MVGPGGDGTLSPAEIDAGLAYIAATPAIWEVILTGGDPLILQPERIAALTTRLASIPHVRIIRWHTRVPVVAPDRITPALVQALLSTDATTWNTVPSNFGNNTIRSVAYGDNLWVAGGDIGQMRTSNNNINLLPTQNNNFFSDGINNIILSDNGILCIEGSEDFFAPIQTNISDNFIRMAYDGENYVLQGENGFYKSNSTDFTTWTTISTPAGLTSSDTTDIIGLP